MNTNKGRVSKSLLLYIENISTRMTKEHHNRLISNIIKENKANWNVKVKQMNNPMDDYILSSIGKVKYSLVLNDTIVLFEFFSTKSQTVINTHRILYLYNDIIIYQYSKRCYHIHHLTLRQHTNILLNKEDCTISNVFYNLSSTLPKSKTNIIPLTSNGNLMQLSYDCKSKSLLHYSKIPNMPHISNQLLINNPNYTHYTFYEIDSSIFILFTINSIFLFDKGNNSNSNDSNVSNQSYAILLHQINISFSKYSYPIHLHSYDLCFISSENFIYQVNMTSRQSHTLSLFGDLSLNFNNEKYKEMIEIIKILLYYHIEIKGDCIEDIITKDNQLTLLFEQYDIHSYVENLSSIISEDNASFFINYNLNSSKLQVIIIYSVIYKKYTLLNRLIKIISANEGNYLLFTVFLEDVIIDFFSSFESMHMKEKMKEVNENILQSIINDNKNSDSIISIDKLSNYYDISK